MNHAPAHTLDIPIQGFITRDAAWLAQDQNGFLQTALQKLERLKDAFELEPSTFGDLLDLERVLEDMERVNHATLTAFQAAQVDLVDPGEIIRNTVDLVRALGRNATVIEVRDLPKDLWMPILSTHFQQVIFNVLANAQEALPAVGGCIHIAASLQARAHPRPGLGRSARKALHITVEDNAPGLPLSLRRSLLRKASQTPDGGGPGLGHALKLLGLYGGTLRFERLEPGTRTHVLWPF